MRDGARKKAYNRWQGIVSRCTNPEHPRWADYGGRGIDVCAEWLESFDAFYAHVGVAPAGLSLDRIDNDRGYAPDNVRWATYAEQAQNRRASGRDKTHCPAGHAYTPDNLLSGGRRGRDCKACHRDRARARTAKKRAA